MSHGRWLKAGLLAAWLLFAAYALWGVPQVPFHPDESTYLYMSRDFDLLARQGNAAALSWQASGQPADVRRYRLLDSPLSHFLPGLGRLLAGYAAPLPHDWDWSGGWAANETLGAVPSAGLLTAARWPSAMLTVLSLLPLYAIGQRLGGPAVGVVASLLYALSGLVLLHGRRAMAEGPLLFFILLTIWLILAAPRLPLLWAAGAALAVAAKLSALSLLLVLGLALLWPAAGEQHWLTRQRLIGAAASAVGFSGLSWLLTPDLWMQPLAGLAAMLDARRQLSTGVSSALSGAAGVQVATTLPQRLFAMLYHIYFAPPAFWEIPNYAQQTAAAEQNYLSHPVQVGWHTTSLSLNLALGGLLLALSLAGLVFAIHRVALPSGKRAVFAPEGGVPPLVVMLAWTVATVAGLLAINIAWQRYYLPLLPIVCLWAGYGASQVARPFRVALAARRAPAA